jgi:hypothetical protein
MNNPKEIIDMIPDTMIPIEANTVSAKKKATNPLTKVILVTKISSLKIFLIEKEAMIPYNLKFILNNLKLLF